jgi:hypothetical protein
MTVTPINIDWREERLYVLHMIEDLTTEQRRISEEAAIARVNVAEKLKKDIHEAHDKIRKLEHSDTMLRIKNWIMAMALGGAGALLVELVKAWLQKGRP